RSGAGGPPRPSWRSSAVRPSTSPAATGGTADDPGLCPAPGPRPPRPEAGSPPPSERPPRDELGDLPKLLRRSRLEGCGFECLQGPDQTLLGQSRSPLVACAGPQGGHGGGHVVAGELSLGQRGPERSALGHPQRVHDGKG